MATVNTTLVNATRVGDLQVTLASTAGLAKGMLLRIGAEKLRVTSVDRAPTIGVVPGFDGTTAEAHLVLSKVTFGLPHEFAFVDYTNRLEVSTTFQAIEDGISTAGRGLPAIRAAAHFTDLTAMVPSVTTYTPLVDTTLNIMASILVTVSAAEAFTVQYAYTDTGGTARVAILPLRNLLGQNLLAVNFAQGAIPYAGVTQQFRARGGLPVTIATAGIVGGATFSMSAVILDSQTDGQGL